VMVNPVIQAIGWEADLADSTANWTYTVGPIAALISPLFLGAIADRFFATQRVLATMHLLAAIPMLALPSLITADASSAGMMIGVVSVHMLCYMPTLGLTNTLTFANVSDQAKQFPMIRVFGTLGWIVGNLAAGPLMESAGGPALFYLTGGAGLVLAVFSLSLPHTPPPKKGQPANLGAVFGLDAIALLRDRSFFVFILASFLICIPLAAYYAWTSAYLVDGIGYTDSEVALRMPIGQAAEVVFMVAMPWFFARLGVKKMIAIGMVAWVVRYALFASAADEQVRWMVLVGIGLHGICYDFFFVTGQIYVDKFAPPDIRGQAQGFLVLVTQGLGLGIGAQVIGQLVGQTTTNGVRDWETFWRYPAIGAAVILVGFWWLFRGAIETEAEAEA
ncbi:MAG: MFS transporter, partial [Planctomycetes bacterium]|nr:MFS transporter [Planctomycetota bacterium]